MENPGEKTIGEQEISQDQLSRVAVGFSQNAPKEPANVSSPVADISSSVSLRTAEVGDTCRIYSLREQIVSDLSLNGFCGGYRNYLVDNFPYLGLPQDLYRLLSFTGAPCFRIYDDMNPREIAEEFRENPEHVALYFASNLYEECIEKILITMKFDAVRTGQHRTYSEVYREHLNDPTLPQPDPDQLAELDSLQSEMIDMVEKYCANPQDENVEATLRGLVEKTIRAEGLLNPAFAIPEVDEFMDQFMANLAQVKKYSYIARQVFLKLILELSPGELADLKQRIRDMAEPIEFRRRHSVFYEQELMPQFYALRFPDETAEGES